MDLVLIRVNSAVLLKNLFFFRQKLMRIAPVKHLSNKSQQNTVHIFSFGQIQTVDARRVAAATQLLVLLFGPCLAKFSGLNVVRPRFGLVFKNTVRSSRFLVQKKNIFQLGGDIVSQVRFSKNFFVSSDAETNSLLSFLVSKYQAIAAIKKNLREGDLLVIRLIS